MHTRESSVMGGGVVASIVAATLACGDGGPNTSEPDAGTALLTSLEVSQGDLVPAFEPNTTQYVVDLPLGATELTLTATAPRDSLIELNGQSVASSEPSTVTLTLGDNAIEVQARSGTSERLYTVTVRRGAGINQQNYIKASNTDAIDNFGSVAIDGDTLVVGAPFESSSATGVDGDQTDNAKEKSGAVYVFVRSGDSWIQEAYLKASNTDADDVFGAHLAIDGDTLVVGAPGEASASLGINGAQEDNSAPDSGAVYVFVRSVAGWSQEAYIKASNPRLGDGFGLRFALDGDTLVVGARAEDSSATGVDGDQTNDDAANAGAAYVFRRSGTTWSQEAYLKGSNTEANDNFGTCVALSGDSIAIGALGEASSATGGQTDNSTQGAGAVYVFTRGSGTWSQQAYIKASNAGTDDRFGCDLELASDTLVVGASGEASAAAGVGGDQSDNTAPFTGAVYIFESSQSNWTQTAYIKASNPTMSDRFGSELALDGDVLATSTMFEDSTATGINGDGTNDDAATAGAGYLFVRRNGTWSQQAYIKASNTDTGDLFGSSLDIIGETIVIGAQHEDSNAQGVDGNTNDNSAASSGAVYVFR